MTLGFWKADSKLTSQGGSCEPHSWKTPSITKFLQDTLLGCPPDQPLRGDTLKTELTMSTTSQDSISITGHRALLSSPRHASLLPCLVN